MKSTGRAVFAFGAVLVAIMAIWGWVGFYASSVPVMLLLGGGGIALMAVGSRMHKDKEPNKAVRWQPASVAPPASPAAPSDGDGSSTLGQATSIQEAEKLIDTPAEFAPWVLVGRNGARYQLTSNTLVGRDPGDFAHAITLTDADSSVSKVHALVTISGNTVRVRDMGSTNGTVVVTPEGIEIECEQHQGTAVSAGSTLELGNCALALVASRSPEEA
jgi:hypothetical protein